MAFTIVVGLDGSSGSLRALNWAAETATRVDARLTPALAWQYPSLALMPFPAGYPVPPAESMEIDAKQRAAGMVQSIVELGAIDVTEPIVRQGGSGVVLCEAAEGADLLVVGSRGLGSIKGTILGSVSAHCAAASPCPLAIIPSGEPDRPPTDLVVIGVDGSPLSDAAVEWADIWAPENAILLVVHVWDIQLMVDGVAVDIDLDAVEQAAAEIVDGAASLVTRHEVETSTIRGDARIQLKKLAKDADMLVIGARGHSVFERFLMGSVASYTAHHLVAPTVIVRPTE
ncbi:MAG: universal stress protein [Acidimicrobiia bacterium]|nr:universal stress protein [Acidimicrobiia bacterium]